MCYREAKGNLTKAATLAKMKYGSFRDVIKRVELKALKAGFAPEHDMTKTCPSGYRVKGTSTLYDDEGNPKIQWVKTEVDNEQRQRMMEEAIKAMCDDMPTIKPVLLDRHLVINQDLMSIYPLGDPHIGMLAWAEETGQDWDLKISTEKMCGVFDRLVNASPPCAEAVIVNLGDFFHTDNMEGTTSRSGHSLDTDGRYAKMIQVGVKIIRQMIDSALKRHGKVRVINAVGNHDDTGSLFLAVCLGNIYENEPRVTVDQTPAPFHYFRWGASFFGVHHGHTCKAANLPLVMATDQAKEWGDTEFRTWLTGHIHHDTRKEYAGCDVESFRTLAAKDAYATWGGYRARQDSKAIVVHKSYGEVERHTINIKQVI
jgi:hypothetical protein